jgi:hypothetical protein
MHDPITLHTHAAVLCIIQHTPLKSTAHVILQHEKICENATSQEIHQIQLAEHSSTLQWMHSVATHSFQYILDWGELLPWQQCDITYYKHIDTMTSLLGNSLLWVHICPRWCKEQIPDSLSSWFKCSPMSIYCFHCTVSGCDGGNRTRNIAVYTWRLSTLSYNCHLLSYNHHPLS